MVRHGRSLVFYAASENMEPSYAIASYKEPVCSRIWAAKPLLLAHAPHPSFHPGPGLFRRRGAPRKLYPRRRRASAHAKRRVAASADATSAAAAAALAGTFSGAGLDPPNASRRRRATGASTVEDADFTNSPCSLSRARTSLLVTPSSLANSCTRALPAATTSPSRRGDSGGPRLGFSYDAWSSGLHGVLMFFATCFSCSVVRRTPTWSTTAEGSGEPVTRSARANARRRTASVRHC